MKKVVISIGLVVVVALVTCLVPLKTVAYTVMVDYEDIETYYENEPYQVTESYTEDVPLSFEADAYVKEDTIEQRNRIVIGGIVFQDEIVEVPIEVACVELENTDDVAGTFTVYFSGFEPIFGEPSQTTDLELYPGQQKIAECPADSIDEWSYEVTASTREVEGERTVTKYRQVERERTVTRERTETHYKKVSIFEYLLSR